MILNLVVILLIALITAYLATQGMLSSLLALATSIFSSILAMALMEPLQGMIAGWRPDYARGVTFLLLFFLAFSITRFGADMAVPKNIKLSLLVNRIAGGLIGFFVSLVVVGTIIVGIELMPVNRTPLGFERFPGEAGMQAVDNSNRPILGEVSPAAGIWFKPDRFVMAIWDAASGRSLGGSKAFASVHPDLSVESYGYRNHFDGSMRTLRSDLLKGAQGWKLPEGMFVVDSNPLPRGGFALYVVRTRITKGDKAPYAADADGNMRIAASQVRLVTDKGTDYYPIGYLEKGRDLQLLTLNTGYVCDDFANGMAIDDWVFQLPNGEVPQMIEVKELARADIELKEKAEGLAQGEQFPPKAYMKKSTALHIEFDPKARNIRDAKAYILDEGFLIKNLNMSYFSDAHNRNIEIDKAMKSGSGGWIEKGAPGVPPLGAFLAAESYGRDLVNGTPDTAVQWQQAVPLLLLSEMEPDGGNNLNKIPKYFNNDLNDLLSRKVVNKRGSAILGFGTLDKDLSITTSRVIPGNHPVIISLTVGTQGGDRAFYVWAKQMEFGVAKKDRNGEETYEGPPKQVLTAGDGATISLDLDEKVP